MVGSRRDAHPRGKLGRLMLVVFAPLVLLPVGWVGVAFYLTAANDKACGEATSGPKESGDAARSEELRRVLDRYSAKKGRVGLQATVVFPDGTTWSGASGYADQGKGCPLTLNHHMYVGSITKLYTATLVMEQVEKGAISLDDTLDKWLGLPYAKSVTVRMLLNHTSGIPSYTEDPWFLARYFGLPSKRWDPDELVRVIDDKRLKFEPGSHHEYSNSNYLLLGVILEKTTGKTYETLLRDLVREKLGLRDTFFLAYPNDLAISDGYDESLLHLGRRNLTGFRTSLETGAFSAGGILSDSEDLALFAHSLFTRRIVSDQAVARMETFVEAPDEDVPLQKGYGLGVRNLMIGGEDLVGHTGTIPGYSGIALHNREKNYTIVVLSNLSVVEQMWLFAEVQDVVLRKP